MENKEIRRANLAALIESHGSIRALADKVGTAPNYLSEIKNRERDMGDRLARKIEGALELPTGWMDTSHVAEQEASNESERYFEAETSEVWAEKLLLSENGDVAKAIERLLSARAKISGH